MLLKICISFVVILRWALAANNGYMDDFVVEKITDTGSTTWIKLSEGARECGFYTERRCESACYLAVADQARRAYERLAFCWEVVWEPRALRVKCLVPMLSRGSIDLYVEGRKFDCIAGNSSHVNKMYQGPKYHSSICSMTIDTPDTHVGKLFQCQYTYVENPQSPISRRYTLDTFVLRDNGTVEKPKFVGRDEDFQVDLSDKSTSVDCYVSKARVGSQLEIILIDQRRDETILATKRSEQSDERVLRVSYANFTPDSSGKFVTCRHRHLSNKTADSAPLHLVRKKVNVTGIALGILFALTILLIIGCAIIIWQLRRRIQGLENSPAGATGRQGDLSMGRSAIPPELPSRNQPNGYVVMTPVRCARKWTMPIYDQLRFGMVKQNSEQNGHVSEGVYEDIEEVLPGRTPRLRDPAGTSPGRSLTTPTALIT